MRDPLAEYRKKRDFGATPEPSLCKQHNCNPRAIYKEHLAELKRLMKRGAGQQKK